MLGDVPDRCFVRRELADVYGCDRLIVHLAPIVGLPPAEGLDNRRRQLSARTEDVEAVTRTARVDVDPAVHHEGAAELDQEGVVVARIVERGERDLGRVTRNDLPDSPRRLERARDPDQPPEEVVVAPSQPDLDVAVAGCSGRLVRILEATRLGARRLRLGDSVGAWG